MVQRTDPADIAANHLSAGRVKAAQLVYEEMLARNAADPRAIGGIGAIALQSGDVARAMDLFAEATRIAPRDAQSMLNLGVGYQATGKAAEAELCFRRALELDETLPSAHGNLASLLAAKGDTDAAVDHLERAVDLAPEAAEFRYNLGNMRLHAGDSPGAVQHYEEALALDPDHIPARNNLALVLKLSGDLQAAVHHLTEARMREPGHPEVQINLADALSQLDRHEEAIALARNAAALAPGSALVRSGYGVVLMNAGQLDDAMVEFGAAVKANPKDPTAPLHMTTLLRRQGRLEAALIAAERAAALTQEPGIIHLLKGEILLALERFDEGWAAFDWVAEHTETVGDLPVPLTAAALKGQTLRLLALEPASAIFCGRLLPDLADQGVDVEVYCPPALARLIAGLPGVKRAIASPTIDVGALQADGRPLSTTGDLPRLMRASPAAAPIPPRIPAGIAADFAKRIDGLDGPTVGVWWEAEGLSIDPARLLAACGGTPVILQTGEMRAALGDAPPLAGDLSAAIGDYLDLAAAIRPLSAVVALDGPVAHLAAALGVRTYVLAGRDRSWHWSGEEDRASWYPDARVLYQGPDGDWSAALEALATFTGGGTTG
jgi:Flp pilus assembly protein TadD